MKFSVALSLAVAPMALAKAVHNVYPLRRNGLDARENKESENSRNSNSNNKGNNNNNKGNNVGGNSILVGNANLSPEQAFLLGQQLGAQQAAGQIALLEQALLLWVFPGGQQRATTIINIQPAATGVAGSPAAAVPPAAVTPPAQVAPPAEGASNTVAQPATGTAPAGTGTTHLVDVGKGGLAFSPTEIKAAIGDTVIFTFVNANHTATQSAFDTPCDPLAGGMDSGFQANPNATVNPPPQVAMQVQVANPLWFFCRQNGHCGKGMTFSINPTADKTQALFQSKAIQQKGTGADTAITGGTGAGNGTAAAPAAPAAPVEASSSAAAVGGAASLTATLGGGAEATATLGSGGAAATGVTTGTGQIDASGQCICAVQCAPGSFASNQQGANAFGGFAGAIPAAMAMTV